MHVPRHAVVIYGSEGKERKKEKERKNWGKKWKGASHRTSFVSDETRIMFNNISVLPLKQMYDQRSTTTSP